MQSATRPRPYGILGQKIRRARELTGLSQENFAPKVGTTRRHLIRIEAGFHRPGQTLLEAVARETGVAKDSLTNTEDDEESSLYATLLTDLRAIVRAEIAAADRKRAEVEA